MWHTLPDAPLRLLAAGQVAFLVGIMYTLVGVLRLGWLTNFISTSVIAGFMSGAAITIGLSQVCLRPTGGLESFWALRSWPRQQP